MRLVYIWPFVRDQHGCNPSTMKLVWFFLLGLQTVCNVLPIDAQNKCDGYECIKKLRADLLSGYDVNSRPVKTHNISTTVYAYLNPQFFFIDDVKNMLTLHAWYHLLWRDEHLQWTRDSYGNIRHVHFKDHEIWQPDLHVYNNADNSEIDHYQSTRAVATPGGWVYWTPPTKFQVRCEIDLRRWPYDNQECEIMIGSWTYVGDEIDLKGPRNGTVNLHNLNQHPNREWDVISFEGYTRPRQWNYGDGYIFPDMYYILKVKRRPESFSATVTVPALMIVLLTLVTFWLHPTSPERLNINIANVIISSLFLQYLGRLIPSNGNYAPLIVLFFRDSLVMVGISIAMTIIFRRLLSIQRTSPIPLPSFVTNLVDGWFGKILCLKDSPEPTRSSGDESNPESDGGKLLDPTSGGPKGSWSWLVLLFDRLAFLLYLIVFFIFVFALL